MLVIRRHRAAKSQSTPISQMTDEQFEAETDRVFEQISLMMANAADDASAILSALPDLPKLATFEGDKHQRYVYVQMFSRSMAAICKRANLFSLIELVEIVTRHAYVVRALNQHAPKRRAREFVRTEWERHKEAYNGNKSAFARDYCRRVKNEFSVQVTEKQMREVWLRDSPPSVSTQAGLQAGG